MGHYFTAEGVKTWYLHIQKPTWTPPDYLFGPVWTLLYLSMAVSLWLVWSSPKPKTGAYVCFGIQLTLNLVWSALFFTIKNPFLAFIDIIALLIFIAATIYSFHKIKPLASYLLIPYFLWVLFASALNFSIWSLNRSL